MNLKTAIPVSIALLLAPVGAASADPLGSTVVPLYPEGVIHPPSVPELREDPDHDGQINIRNVGMPTLEVFRPAARDANGIAIIVTPGGGFMNLVYSNEGTFVARRLAAQGYTAVVLKYRLVQTPASRAAMDAKMMKDMGGVLTRAKSGLPRELPRFSGEDLAQQDGAQAIRAVRAHAAEWGVDPKRIGFVGFSAGAFVAADLAIGDRATRPDFVGIIYGGLRTPVPRDAPPAFIATAADDPMLPNDPVPLYSAWRAAGRPAELHIYDRGGHGFGMATQGASSDHWFDEFVWWMQSRGLAKPAAVQLVK